MNDGSLGDEHGRRWLVGGEIEASLCDALSPIAGGNADGQCAQERIDASFSL